MIARHKMSIVSIITSPRKGGNSETIANAIAESARKNGKEVQTFYINAIADRKGCQGCMGCKKAGHCVVKDGLTPVIDAVRKADGIILSTPVYFMDSCAQYRLVEDRFYSFINGDFSLNIPAGKKVATVATCASHGADEVADKMEKTMTGYLKCECIGKIALSGGGPPNVAAGQPDVLAKAADIGKKF